MAGVLIGFAIIGSVIAVGYIVGRTAILGPTASTVLGRAAFFVFLPALLFSVMAEADLAVLFSALLPVSAIAAFVCIGVFILVARLLWRRSAAPLTIGALAAGYVNSNNIGLPVAAYVIGQPALVAPVLLFQLLVLAPIALTVLDLATSGALSWRRVLTQPVRNPLIIASVLGLVAALLGIDLPEPVMEPFRLLGAAAVPIVLFVFGLSLHGRKILEPGSGRRDVALVVVLKNLVMPLVAWAVGSMVFGLTEAALFAVVVLAALPTAQNVYTYAARYQVAMPLARDAALITTIVAIPVLIVITAFLAPV